MHLIIPFFSNFFIKTCVKNNLLFFVMLTTIKNSPLGQGPGNALISILFFLMENLSFAKKKCWPRLIQLSPPLQSFFFLVLFVTVSPERQIYLGFCCISMS